MEEGGEVVCGEHDEQRKRLSGDLLCSLSLKMHDPLCSYVGKGFALLRLAHDCAGSLVCARDVWYVPCEYVRMLVHVCVYCACICIYTI